MAFYEPLLRNLSFIFGTVGYDSCWRQDRTAFYDEGESLQKSRTAPDSADHLTEALSSADRNEL